jgi:transcriptional regulator with XRE-family HTH domain
MTVDITKIRATSVYAEEALVVDLQSLLHAVMIEKGMTRSQLAQAMGVSKARVTQLFSADCGNFTVRLLARALHALGEQLEVNCPTHQKVRRRLKLIQEFEESCFGLSGSGILWEMPANDHAPMQVAKSAAGEMRTKGLIARSLERTTEHRRAA